MSSQKNNKKTSPFDFINAINNKQHYDLIETAEDDYNPFLINRGLSHYMDCVFFCAEINKYASILDNKLQFDFYWHGLTKKKRFSKWQKSRYKTDKEHIELIQIIMDYYGYSKTKAEEVLPIFLSSPENNKKTLLEIIKKEELTHGGRTT